MSSFNPTPAEAALTTNFFNLADLQKLGIVTGDVAVKVLSGANLSTAVLGEIWAIADKENNGFLTRKGVSIALRLIGYAQNGDPVSEELLDKPGPLAHIDGVTAPPTVGSSPPPTSLQKSPPSIQNPILPPLTQQDITKFSKLFIGCEPINGLLSGDKARDVFIKSKLPYEKLSQIWTLSDTKTRGALDNTDFIIGMYLIQASMSSSNFVLPPMLPSWLYEQAAQKDGTTVVTSNMTGGSASGFGHSLQGSMHIQKQYTGSGTTPMKPGTVQPQTLPQAIRQVSHTNKNPVSSSFRGVQSQGQQWDVTAEAKVSSDQFFDSLDTQRRGYIEGDIAVPFMLQSTLPEDDLARIWDLSDLYSDGKLTRDGFAVAMHLINSRLGGADIPTVLPPSLVPPSMRTQRGPVTGQMTGEPLQDLLGDEIPASSAMPSQPTGDSMFTASIPNDTSPHRSAGKGAFQPALPPSQQPSVFRPAVNKDLLGDDDDEPLKANDVPDNSAEIGNLRNQVASTTRSHSTTQAERISVEQSVTQQASHLSQLQTQLSAAKASYETESRLLGTLRERLASQRAEIQKTQEELIRAESDLSATKVEKAEVEGSVLRDKEEIRELQRKMKEITDQSDSFKSSIEKAKKDARQQKGLLAIAKKQLATAEAEKLRVGKELEEAQKDSDFVQKEKEEIDAHIADLQASESLSKSAEPAGVDPAASPVPSTFAAGIPLPNTPQSTTPQPTGSRQSTNPFERLAMASIASPKSSFPPSSGALASVPAGVLSDPFGISTGPPEPSASPPKSTIHPPFDLEGGTVIPKTSDDKDEGVSPPALGLTPSIISPSDSEAQFLTPPSTANARFSDDANGTAQAELSVPGAFPHDIDSSGNLTDAQGIELKPLEELANIDSDTSDSDDEPLGAKFIPKNSSEQPGPDSTSSPTTLTSSKVSQPGDALANESTTMTAIKASPPTSGKSSPRRSQSPGRALSTRSLSSHSIPNAMDPFGAASFTQTPLEPPAGESAPPPTIETVLEPSASPANVSSISDFDEAFGKMPSSTKDPGLAFKFDSKFDDNFDFAAAMNGTTDAAVSFSDANVLGTQGSLPFGTQAMTQPTPEPKNEVPTSHNAQALFGEVFTPNSPVGSPSNGAHELDTSFDDAFGISQAEQPHANGQPPITNGTGTRLSTGTGLSKASQDSSVSENPFPISSSPPVPSKTQPSPPSVREVETAIRPASPQQRRTSFGVPRPSSPPRQTSSSKARSKSSSDSKHEAPPRHRLSIRFPFGRKDKTKDKEDKRAQSRQILDQPQYVSPISDTQSAGKMTPAVEDDAEPVKQLAAMGFSRTQCIAALETHGYDVQKALNSLLGAT